MTTDTQPGAGMKTTDIMLGAGYHERYNTLPMLMEGFSIAYWSGLSDAGPSCGVSIRM
jgi:hypothetical protein